jgi:hypothetical protein
MPRAAPVHDSQPSLAIHPQLSRIAPSFIFHIATLLMSAKRARLIPSRYLLMSCE